MKKGLFPRMAFCLTLITSFLFMPFSTVYADGYSQESEFWRWWYIEHQTDAITDGQGASADNLTDTYNGSTVGQYVYNETGLTADDVKDYVKQQYENAAGYVEHTAEWYSDAVDDIWQSSIDVGTKAKYQAEKAIRETVDAAGNTVVNVTSTNYWNNVYNKWFNNNGYKDIYKDGVQSTVTGTVNNKPFSCKLVGTLINEGEQGTDTILTPQWDCYYNCTYNSTFEYGGYVSGYPLFEIKYDGITYYKYYWTSISYRYYLLEFNRDTNSITFRFARSDNNESYWSGGFGFLAENNTSIGKEPELQDKQVGFVLHNGIEFPVYKDTTKNPFTINDNGTVTWDDGSGTEPIYVDPSQLTDDGWLNILEWLDNNDNTQNPYNPQGKPWNTQPDGSTLGGFFSNLIKDISSIFDGIGNIISNLIDKIIKAIKDIANIIIDALKQFWSLLIGDIEEYPDLFETDVDDNFGMISDLYDLLLECMGVDA